MELILEKFTGQNRVPRWQIINHVEQAHCEGIRKLSASEKSLVDDALRSLRDRELADNPERGYWTIRSEEDLTPANNMSAPCRKNIIPNSDLEPEKTIGSGNSSVYLYYYPQYRESAESKGEKVWECKIGRTIHGEVDGRIRGQATGLPESPKIGLHIKTNKQEKIERIIHDILKVRGKHIEDAPGSEWFLTSPSEVEEIYNFIEVCISPKPLTTPDDVDFQELRRNA